VHKRILLALPAAAVVLAAGLPVLTSGATAEPKSTATGPLVFGHRGASGYRPEHTLQSYALAIQLGADVIEPDVVATKDGVLVARHENEIGGTTDVEQKYPERETTKTIDGRSISGWFTEDFTLAELRTLRADERLPEVRDESRTLDGRYAIPTLDEVLALATAETKRLKRTIAVAPETKHPTYFDSIGLSLEERLLADLREAGLDKAHSPVFVQSFEEANLRDLRRLGAKVALVQLTGSRGRPYDHVVSGDPQTYADMTTPAGLAEVAEYADVLGPDKSQIFPRNPAGETGQPTTLVADAHAAGLQVVPYTVRAENQFLPAQYRSSADPNAFGDVVSELHDLYATGIDGVFADQPDLAVLARDDR
jgi:glycerophosphoryl diester phosphodiesterase